MTHKDEALKLALEVMHNQGDVGVDEWIAAEAAIKQALAAPDLQAELDAANRQVEILSDALAESRRDVDALVALVRADEREACAKVCEDDAFVEQWKGLAEAVRRIRARGEHMSKEEYKDAIEISVVFHEGNRMMAVPKQPAVPLTDEQISAIGSKIFPSTWNPRHVEFARAIEAKLKERNT